MESGSARISALTQQWKSWLHDFMWDTNLAVQPLWRRTAIRSLQIAYAVGRDLAEGQLSLRAMSLVYYTVIAIIPLLALTFSVLKGLGVHNAMEPALLNVLQPLGERSLEVTRNIINFVENVRVDVLSIVSLGVLLYTVLNMMQKIEMSFNFIWSVSVGRKFANRVSEYLFAVIVSPLLIFISIGKFAGDRVHHSVCLHVTGVRIHLQVHSQHQSEIQVRSCRRCPDDSDLENHGRHLSGLLHQLHKQ